MWQHDHKVLEEYRVTPAQWAVLLAASYYTPVSRNQLLDLAMLESEFALLEEEVMEACEQCLFQSWIEPYHSADRDPESHPEFPNLATRGQGLVLTERGTTLKEHIHEAYRESVTIV
jgi:hypothetical protein